MFIKLTSPDGQRVRINPDHITMTTVDEDGKTTELHLLDIPDRQFVVETEDEIERLIAGSSSGFLAAVGLETDAPKHGTMPFCALSNLSKHYRASQNAFLHSVATDLDKIISDAEEGAGGWTELADFLEAIEPGLRGRFIPDDQMARVNKMIQTVDFTFDHMSKAPKQC